MSLPRVFFKITVDGQPAGRIEMELRTDVVPKTAENFRALCTGEKGFGYRGSKIHRIVPSFMFQGGDIVNGNGTGNKSIYGETFPDENFALKQTGMGTLMMANAGPDTNGSQFFILCANAPWMDGRHVVFGKVISSYNVLAAIESKGTSSGEPTAEILISDCGMVN